MNACWNPENWSWSSGKETGREKTTTGCTSLRACMIRCGWEEGVVERTRRNGKGEFSWLLPLLLISLLPSVFWVISSWIGGYQSVHGSGVSYPIFPSFSSSPRPLSIPRRLHDFLRLRAWALRCSWCSMQDSGIRA